MKNVSYKTIQALVLLNILFLIAPEANAEAYCALRDPVSSIKKLFPNATNHKSIVRSIDETTRQQVSEEFPQLPLHFGELGRHTLYVAMNGEKAIGMVHVRSEQSPWGLVEIAWAMNMDLTVRDFTFQRCRNRQKKLLTTAEFKLQFMGKSFEDLRTFYDKESNGGTSDYLQAASGADELANVVLKCGLKTLLVTRLAWQDDITELTIATQLKHLNAKGELQLSLIDNIMSDNTKSRLKTITGADNLGISRDSVRAYRVTDSNLKTVALLYQGKATIEDQKIMLSWLLNMRGQVISVETNSPWPSPDVAKLFADTYQRSFVNIDQCGNRAELYALEVATTLHPYFGENVL
ncbi:hypothetical protein EYS14_23880 [Alteromonadaceae bacterium M269]|nr:hypothetical protein EYS14_23880 [Alteromonadaceae bacterium M269]